LLVPVATRSTLPPTGSNPVGYGRDETGQHPAHRHPPEDLGPGEQLVRRHRQLATAVDRADPRTLRRHPTSAEGDRTLLVAVPHSRPTRIVRPFGPHTAVTSCSITAAITCNPAPTASASNPSRMSSASSAITTLTVSGAPHFLAAVTAFW